MKPDTAFAVPRGDWIAVALICVAAFVIRLHAIGDASLWTDEGFSIWFARQPIGDLWGEIARNEYNPTLYYMVLHGWIAVFGESAAAVRTLSALINCLTIPFVYLTTRWAIRSPQAPLVATLAAILFALAFSELQYAQEARTYTLCVLAVAMALAATMRILGGVFDLRGGVVSALPRWPFVLLGFGAALSVWAHYTSLIFLAVLGLFHIWLFVTVGGRSRHLLIRYAFAVGTFILLGGRALWLMVAYALPASDNFWIGVPSFTDVIDATSIVFGGAFAVNSWSLEVFTRAILFGPWPFLGAIALWRRGNPVERSALILLVSSSLVAFAAYLAVTYLGKPVFLLRVVLPAQLGWVVLCAASIMALQSLRLRQVAASLLVFSFAISAVSYLTSGGGVSSKEPWKEIARQIVESAEPGETVFVTATGEILIGHYFDAFDRTDLSLVSINGSYNTPPARPMFDRGGIYYSTPLNEAHAHAFAEQLEETPRAWIVLRNPDRDSWDLIRPIISETDAQYTRFEPGPLGVYRILPDTAPGTGIASEAP